MDLNELNRIRRSRPVKPVAAPAAPVPSQVAEAVAKADSLAPMQLLGDDQAQKAALALRVSGYTIQEIAAELGSSISVVRRLLKASEPKRKVLEDLIDGRAVPAAIDNLITGLESGDKDYTLETLKGRGLLVKHSHQDGQAPKSAFQFNIVVEHPKDGHLEPLLGSVVGEPRELEAAREDRRGDD